MALKRNIKNLAYGFNNPLQGLAPEPIIAVRNPTTADQAEIGTQWINKSTNSAYVLTSIVNNISNWEAIGGANTIEKIDGNSGSAIPTAGLINFDGTQGSVFTGATDTITLSFENLQLGTSASRIDTFSSDNNTLQVYNSTINGVAGTTYRAIRGDLSVVNGDGTESPQAVRSNLTAAAGANVEEVYGSFNLVTVSDGSEIDSNAIGSLSYVLINETTPADQPQQWIAGSQSIVGFNDAAGVPTATIVAASLNHVTYDIPSNGRAHGVVVSRNGSGAGGTAASAFKVLIGGGIDDWEYGVDLYTGSTANNYSVADARLSQENRIHTGSGAPNFATTPGSIYLRIDGANAGEVLYVNHDGQAGSWAALT